MNLCHLTIRMKACVYISYGG